MPRQLYYKNQRYIIMFLKHKFYSKIQKRYQEYLAKTEQKLANSGFM